MAEDDLQETWEENLLEWKSEPIKDFGLPSYLVEACEKSAAGIIKAAQEAGDNISLPKLLHWPSESVINTTIKLAFDNCPAYKDVLPTEEHKRDFLQELSQTTWKRISEELSEEGIQQIEREVEISYITREITKVIKLEQYYTSLPALGTLFWERACSELRDMTNDKALIDTTENSTLLISITRENTRREIPDWIRGLILAYALQGVPGSTVTLDPKVRLKANPQSFREASIWALGTHLSIGGKKQYLEDTVEAFKRLKSRRKKVNLNLKMVTATEIEPEVEIAAPEGREGERYPWLLCWGILPNTDIEVRELADTWTERGRGKENILSQYHYRFLQRTIWYLCRREILFAYEERSTLRENWLVKTGIKDPILEYLKSRIPEKNKLLFAMAFTECVWKQFCPLAKG